MARPVTPAADRPAASWSAEDETDAVTVDTTVGELQRLEAAPGISTVGELELVELLEQRASRWTAGPVGLRSRWTAGPVGLRGKNPHLCTAAARRARIKHKALSCLALIGVVLAADPAWPLGLTEPVWWTLFSSA